MWLGDIFSEGKRLGVWRFQDGTACRLNRVVHTVGDLYAVGLTGASGDHFVFVFEDYSFGEQFVENLSDLDVIVVFEGRRVREVLE